MSAPLKPRSYAVFISYRHADNKELGRQWGSWLHQVLENYEVPPDLVGAINSQGKAVPASLYPVFRDEEELPANADLTRPIREALENSSLCVVICSPRAVASSFVADEIRCFKELGKADRIIALIIDGEPNVTEDPAKRAVADLECFPQPLRYGVPREDGTIDWTVRAEPIAADVRPGGMPSQGWTTAAAYRSHLEAATRLNSREVDREVREYEDRLELAKLKIVAGALGVQLGLLTQRDKARQLVKARQRARALRKWLSAVGIFAALAVVAGALAYQKERQTAALLGERARLDRVAALEAYEGGHLTLAVANLARACRDLPDDARTAEAACILLQQMPQPPALTSPLTAVVDIVPNRRGTRLLLSDEVATPGIHLFDTATGEILTTLRQQDDSALPRIGQSEGADLFYAVRYERGVSTRFTLIEPTSGEVLREIVEPVLEEITEEAVNAMYGDPLVWEDRDAGRLMVPLGRSLHEVLISHPFTARRLANFPSAPEGFASSAGGPVVIWGSGFARVFSDRTFTGEPLELEPLKLGRFSPNGETLWSWGENQRVEVRQQPFNVPKVIRENVEGVVVSENGRFIALRTSEQVEVFDFATSRKLWGAAATAISSVAFSVNEEHLAIVSQGAAECFSSADGTSVARFDLSTESPVPETEGTDGTEGEPSITAVFSPDSRWLAVTANGQLHLADTKYRQAFTNPEMQKGEQVRSVSFNSLGNRLGAAIESNYDPSTGEDGGPLVSRWMLLSLSDEPEGEETAKQILEIALPSAQNAVFSPDGLRAVLSFEQEARIIDAVGGAILQSIELPWSSGNLDSILPGEGVFLSGHSSRYKSRPLAFYPITSSRWILRLTEEPNAWDHSEPSAIHSVRFYDDDSGIEVNGEYKLRLDLSFTSPGLQNVRPEPRADEEPTEEEGRILFSSSQGQLQVEGNDLLVRKPGDAEPLLRLSGNERPLTQEQRGAMDIGRLLHGTYFFSATTSTDFSRVATSNQDVGGEQLSVRWWDLSGRKPAAGMGQEIARFSTHAHIGALALDNRQRRLVLASAGGGLEMRWLLPPDQEVPPWFGDVLEYYAMKRLDRLTGRPVEFVPTEADAGPVEMRRKLEEVALALNDNSDYTRILRWALARGNERTLDPFSELTFKGAGDLLIKQASTARDLELVYRLDSSNPLIHIEMAAFERDEWRAGFLRDYDLERMPNDVDLWTRAIRSLHNQEDRDRVRRALVKLEKLFPEAVTPLKKELGL